MIASVGAPRGSALAALTSDFDFGIGYTDVSIKIGSNSANISSIGTIDGSYNLNNAAWNAALIINFSEAAQSSQGPLSWTRVGLGVRYYLTGFGAQRVIFDNKVEGKYLRPAPFIAFTTGLSSFSIQKVGSGDGYFNAATMDYNLRLGAEVVLMPNYFLTGQWSTLIAMPTEGASEDIGPFSYVGNGIYIGLKITSN